MIFARAEFVNMITLQSVAFKDSGAERELGEVSGGCVSAIDSNGRTIWIADAHRDSGKRFVVHSDQKVTAFVELESAVRVVAY
jgi:hypothetical protein